MKKIGDIIDYGSFAPLVVHWHHWERQWHISIFNLVWGDSDRSFFSIGQDYKTWFIDVLWMRVAPRVD